MISNWLRWLGPIFLLGLIAIVAITSVISSETTQQVVNSIFFIGIILFIVGFGLIINLSSFQKKNFQTYSRIIIHIGLAIGIIGVWLNQTKTQSGYLFLESSGKTKNFYLNKNLKVIDELPISLKLDSISYKYQKGFNPAPIAWLQINNNTYISLTYNRPFYYKSQQFLLNNMVNPGFPHNYELSVNNQPYTLLHNQKLKLSDGTTIWSYAYDYEAKKMGLMVDDQLEWLNLGDTLRKGNSIIILKSADFAQFHGVILLVKEIHHRYLIFLGFGLTLIGLIPNLFEKKVI